jgi:hypothetical protein
LFVFELLCIKDQNPGNSERQKAWGRRLSRFGVLCYMIVSRVSQDHQFYLCCFSSFLWGGAGTLCILLGEEYKTCTGGCCGSPEVLCRSLDFTWQHNKTGGQRKRGIAWNTFKSLTSFRICIRWVMISAQFLFLSDFFLSLVDDSVIFRLNHWKYSGWKVTPALGYAVVRGEGKVERARWWETADNLSELVYSIWKHFISLNFVTVGGILIRWLLYYTVFCEAKEIRNTSNADTCLNLVQPKHEHFTSVSTRKDWVSTLYVL